MITIGIEPFNLYFAAPGSREEPMTIRRAMGIFPGMFLNDGQPRPLWMGIHKDPAVNGVQDAEWDGSAFRINWDGGDQGFAEEVSRLHFGGERPDSMTIDKAVRIAQYHSSLISDEVLELRRMNMMS